MFKPHGAFFNRDYAVNRFHCRDREGYLPFAFSKTHRLTPGGPFRIKFGCGGRRTTPLKSTSQIHNGMLTHELGSSTAPRTEGKGE
ncbi:hypothetical protein SERMG_00577 [Serratia marcescens]|nr:hypothetical protein NVIRSERR_02576 [Serratia marcescens]